MKKVNVAIIRGTGTDDVINAAGQVRIGTPFGMAASIFLGEIGGKNVAFLPHHNVHYSVPPHKVNFAANMAAGLEKHLRSSKFANLTKKPAPILQEVLKETVLNLPEKRRCPCANALKEAKW